MSYGNSTYRSRPTGGGGAGAARSVELLTIKGVVSADGVTFPISLPQHYMVRVNGVSFSKGHFSQLTQDSIERKDYINDSDLVELDYVVLV